MPSTGPNHDPFGQAGEQFASHWLESQGIDILRRNWTCPLGEIDLIVRDGDALAFIEVKARRDLEKGHPLEAVTPRKQRQILRCVKAYLQQFGDDGLNPRCDAIGILFDREPPDVSWVKNAFGE